MRCSQPQGTSTVDHRVNRWLSRGQEPGTQRGPANQAIEKRTVRHHRIKVFPTGTLRSTHQVVRLLHN